MRELVISRYNENLEWADKVQEYFDLVSVYNKGDQIDDISYANIQNINNVGREAQTWVYHIISKWDKIADYTFFVQGSPFHHSEYILDILKLEFKQPIVLTNRYMKDWPGEEVTKHDLIITKEDIKFRMGDMRFFGHKSIEFNKVWFSRIWKEVFDCEPPNTHYYGYGGMWSIPKKTIKQRPIEFWININKKLQHNEEAFKRPLDAWAMEALWSAVWTNPEIYPGINDV